MWSLRRKLANDVFTYSWSPIITRLFLATTRFVVMIWRLCRAFARQPQFDLECK
ncbi:hypothetical protein BJX65DRAFT_284739 [Aspergillus insuetus]